MNTSQNTGERIIGILELLKSSYDKAIDDAIEAITELPHEYIGEGTSNIKICVDKEDALEKLQQLKKK